MRWRGAATAAELLVEPDRAEAIALAVSDTSPPRQLRIVYGLAADAREAADRLRAALPTEHAYPLEIARAQVTLREVERTPPGCGARGVGVGRGGYAAAGCRGRGCVSCRPAWSGWTRPLNR